MRRLHRVLTLPRGDRSLLIRSELLVIGVRVGLSVLPFRVLRRLLERLTPEPAVRESGGGPSADRVAWAVRRTSRTVPAATCLTQALAAQVLLRRYGIPARIHIGVAKDESNRLVAHAWVESGGRVVIGGGGLEQYTPLMVLEGERVSAPADCSGRRPVDGSL
jgi:hypothetical protein